MMEKIKEIASIGLSRMNNGAHFTFVDNILDRAKTDTAIQANETAVTLVNAFQKAVEAEDELLTVSRKSLLTDDIEDVDNERDILYVSFKKAVKSFLDIPLPEMAAAAKVLNQSIKDYNIDIKDQLDKETGLLKNLISDLEGKYSEQVSTLSLTPIVTKLKDANERVNTLIKQRSDERTTISVGALRKARSATDDAYYELVRMVNALAVVFGDKDYATFIDYVNVEITRYKREVLGQKSSTESTTTVDDDGEDTTTGGGSSSQSGGSGSGSGSSTTGGGGTSSEVDDYGA